LQERDKINKEIHSAVNKASQEWGVTCLRYEILGINPPENIRTAMEYEVEAERIKRQEILLSEAKKIAKVPSFFSIDQRGGWSEKSSH
jgi:regulator of protease activity HflC (stomatin/prohibitin superfamily)